MPFHSGTCPGHSARAFSCSAILCVSARLLGDVILHFCRRLNVSTMMALFPFVPFRLGQRAIRMTQSADEPSSIRMTHCALEQRSFPLAQFAIESRSIPMPHSADGQSSFQATPLEPEAVQGREAVVFPDIYDGMMRERPQRLQM